MLVRINDLNILRRTRPCYKVHIYIANVYKNPFFFLGDDGIIDALTNPKLTTPRRLTIYISVPICVFLICLCAVASLIIRNRSRQNRQRSVNQRSHKFFLNQNKSAGLNSSNRYLDHSSIAGSTSMAFSRSGSPRGRSLCSKTNNTTVNTTSTINHAHMRPSPLSTANNSSQHVPSTIASNQVHNMQYMYPSSVTECAYFTPDGSAQCPIGYAPMAYPAPGTYLNGVNYQHFPPEGIQHPGGLPMPPVCNGTPAGGMSQHQNAFPNCSGESSACTDLGFDGSTTPFSAGHYSHTPQESEGRLLCVSPSSGPESNSHLQLMQRTNSE